MTNEVKAVATFPEMVSQCLADMRLNEQPYRDAVHGALDLATGVNMLSQELARPGRSPELWDILPGLVALGAVCQRIAEDLKLAAGVRGVLAVRPCCEGPPASDLADLPDLVIIEEEG